jgi:hypothetical protein
LSTLEKQGGDEKILNIPKPIRTAKAQRSFLQQIGKRLKMGFQTKNGYIVAIQYKDLKEVQVPSIELEVKQVTHPNEDELRALANFHFYTHSNEDVLQRLVDGERCYIAKHKGQVVACYWKRTKEFYDFGTRRVFQLAENEEYNQGAFTSPEFRGMGLLEYLFTVSELSAMANNPNLRTYGFIDAHNHSSLKMASKLGFQKVGWIGFIGLFGVRFTYFSGKNVLPKTKNRFQITM